ncbi:MBL fold metallo-hydrolase [Aquabacterium sp.]|uniref:MBL fold metallo-hydrolase n=1 Tax=Aquabacterium sp. TaxID=1872578 RepID=UPI0025BEC3D1|nr:MBL fold metallo-hydrolase [Aquabacterium sp.]
MTLHHLAHSQVEAFFDPATWTVSYLVLDPATRQAAIVDPVLDYDPRSGRTHTTSAERILTRVREQDLSVAWILETHAHADHLSAAAWLRQQTGARVAIGRAIQQVQKTFKALFNLERDFLPDGRQFDHLFDDGEVFQIGSLQATAMLVPGHTPADMAYQVDGAVFVGDTLFMPDVGSARADFPGGDAAQLYRSVQRLLALPPETPLFMCHDYPPAGRAPAWVSTVAEQRAHNIHVHDGVSEAAFVAMRRARDATLDMPTLILPSIQVNVRAGELPPPEDNGVRYLKVPLNAL